MVLCVRPEVEDRADPVLAGLLEAEGHRAVAVAVLDRGGGLDDGVGDDVKVPSIDAGTDRLVAAQTGLVRPATGGQSGAVAQIGDDLLGRPADQLARRPVPADDLGDLLGELWDPCVQMAAGRDDRNRLGQQGVILPAPVRLRRVQAWL